MLWIRPAEVGDPRPAYELIQILNSATDSYTVGAPGQVKLNNPCCALPALCTGGSFLLSGPAAAARVIRGAQVQILSLVAVGDWSRAGALRMSQH